MVRHYDDGKSGRRAGDSASRSKSLRWRKHKRINNGTDQPSSDSSNYCITRRTDSYYSVSIIINLYAKASWFVLEKYFVDIFIVDISDNRHANFYLTVQ